MRSLFEQGKNPRKERGFLTSSEVQLYRIGRGTTKFIFMNLN